MSKLRFEIVTAERLVHSEDVDVVIAPGIEGELGILPSHAPLLTTLQPGVLTVRNGGEELEIFVNGGFLEVMHDKVTILADVAERAEEIDVAQAEEAKRRAEEILKQPSEGVDIAAAEAALRRSLIQLKVAEHRRKKPGSGRGQTP